MFLSEIPSRNIILKRFQMCKKSCKNNLTEIKHKGNNHRKKMKILLSEDVRNDHDMEYYQVNINFAQNKDAITASGVVTNNVMAPPLTIRMMFNIILATKCFVSAITSSSVGYLYD